MFTGLSAFPLTPVRDGQIDESAFTTLVRRLAAARADSITVLGSTGSGAYLDRAERRRVIELALDHAGDVPVLAGVSALATRDVLRHAEDAQRAGVAGVLLAPMSYQTLTNEDVLGLYRDATAELSVPLVVYDNPGTTHFTFTDELYARVTQLPRVASIKIPGVPADAVAATERIQELRKLLPSHVTIGVSGDALAATGLNAGCDAWYSVIGGTLPEPALRITRAAQAGDAAAATGLSVQLRALWDLFARYGSVRVVAVIAEQLGLAERPCLPKPLLGLPDEDRAQVRQVIDQLGLR